jgi:putative peptide zinc metalloprotease protein
MHERGGRTTRTPERSEPPRRGGAEPPAGADGAEGERGRELRPRLAAGIELIGEYEDSGFKEPPYLARRADGQPIQMPRLLYLVAEELDGEKGYDEIAARVSEKFGRRLQADDARMLVTEKLWPLGIVAGPDGQSPALKRVDPMLALRFRAAIVPARAVRAVTTIFYPFFFGPIIVGALAAFAAFDAWLFFVHGVAQPTRALIYNPVLMLMVLALVAVATALHEVGHATAARYGGAEPGVMGAGIYVVWPAFYTDVTDAYRLDKKGRLRTDLGGVYFNVLFILGTAAAYFATRFEPLLVVVLLQHLQILQQFLPFLRLDGYYILSDLTGVPDLFMRIKPTLKSLLPSSETDSRVDALKPWVRWTVTGWVIALVPVLLFTFGTMVVNLPRIFTTAWDSFFVHFERTADSFGGGELASGVAGSVQMATLALPSAGIALTLSRVAKRIATGAWAWSAGNAARRAGVAAASVGAASLMAFTWWPNGDYKPIQPRERGTVQGALAQFGHIPTGRPGLTAEREEALGGAPALSEKTPGLQEEPVAPVDDEEPGEEQGEDEPTATTEVTTDTSTTETTPAETGATETAPSGTPTTETTTTETTTTETTTTTPP